MSARASLIIALCATTACADLLEIEEVSRRPDAGLEDGLVAWYPMDDDPAGGAAADAIGGHPGACTACPAAAAGRVDGAYSFDGVDDEIRIADDEAFHTGSGTIAVWIALVDPGNDAVLSKPLGAAGANSWQLFVRQDMQVLLEASSGEARSPVGAVAAGAWLHLAATWDPAAVRLYLDGVLQGTGQGGIDYDTHDLLIGVDENSGEIGFWLAGLVDDVRIYQRVLSAGEIEALAR